MELRCGVNECGAAGDEYFMLDDSVKIFCWEHRPYNCCRSCHRELDGIEEGCVCAMCQMMGVPYAEF